MIHHRRLQAALLRAGLSTPDQPPGMDTWSSLLGHLSEAFDQAELKLLRQTSAAQGLRHEIEMLLADLASEHFKLEAILSTLPVAVALLDQNGQCLLASPSFTTLLGWTAEELAEGRPLELLSPAMADPEQAMSGRTIQHKGCMVRNASGHVVAMDLALHPRFSGDRMLGAVLLLQTPRSAGADHQDEEGPEELFGLRVALGIEGDVLRASLSKQLRQLGANVLEREPSKLIARLSQAATFGVAFDAVFLDGASTELMSAIRQDKLLMSLPVVAVLEDGAPPTDPRWSSHLVMPCVVEELGELLAEILAPAPLTELDLPSVEALELSVLIVEDEPINRMMVEECVRSAGHNFQSVDSAEQAQTLLEGGSFNVVISDWVMPEMSGPDLCRWLRARPGATNYTYFLLLSGKAESPDVAAEVAACGADDYLVKPLNLAQVLRRLQVAQRFALQEATLRQAAPAYGGTSL